MEASSHTTLTLPLVAKPWALQAQRIDQGAVIGVFSLFLETAITMGVLLWIVQRVTLPRGGVTLIFGLYCLSTMLVTRVPIFLPVWLIAGALGDVAMAALKPASGGVWRFRAFGAVVPLLMWSVYYPFFVLTGLGGGVWLTGYIWIGSVVQAGIVGYLMCATCWAGPGPPPRQDVLGPARPHGRHDPRPHPAPPLLGPTDEPASRALGGLPAPSSV